MTRKVRRTRNKSTKSFRKGRHTPRKVRRSPRKTIRSNRKVRRSTRKVMRSNRKVRRSTMKRRTSRKLRQQGGAFSAAKKGLKGLKPRGKSVNSGEDIIKTILTNLDTLNNKCFPGAGNWDAEIQKEAEVHAVNANRKQLSDRATEKSRAQAAQEAAQTAQEAAQTADDEDWEALIAKLPQQPALDDPLSPRAGDEDKAVTVADEQLQPPPPQVMEKSIHHHLCTNLTTRGT